MSDTKDERGRPIGKDQFIPVDPTADDEERPHDEDVDARSVDSAEADRIAAEEGTIGEADDLIDGGAAGDDRR